MVDRYRGGVQESSDDYDATNDGNDASINYDLESEEEDDNSYGDSESIANYDADFWTKEDYIEATKEIQNICKRSRSVSQSLRFGEAFNWPVCHSIEVLSRRWRWLQTQSPI